MTIRPAATAAFIAVVLLIAQRSNGQTASAGAEVEARVRLAWLADRELCRYYPCARIDDGKLYVGGYVASSEQRRRAAAIAAAVSGLPVVDQLAVHPGLAIAIPRVPSDQLLQQATIAIRNEFPSQSSRWTIVATNDDRIMVQGRVDSIATKLEVSERLRRVRGCHGVVNQLWVGDAVAEAAGERLPAEPNATVNRTAPVAEPMPPVPSAVPTAKAVPPPPPPAAGRKADKPAPPPPTPSLPAPPAPVPPRADTEPQKANQAGANERTPMAMPPSHVTRVPVKREEPVRTPQPKLMERVSLPVKPSTTEPPLLAPAGGHALQPTSATKTTKTDPAQHAQTKVESSEPTRHRVTETAPTITRIEPRPRVQQPQRVQPRATEQRVWTAKPTPSLQPILDRTVPQDLERKAGPVVPAWRPRRQSESTARQEVHGGKPPRLHPWSTYRPRADQSATTAPRGEIQQTSFRSREQTVRRKPLVYTRRKLASRPRSLTLVLPGVGKSRSERAHGFPSPAERNVVQRALQQLCGSGLEQFYLMDGDVLIVRARAADTVAADRLARGVFALPELRIYEVHLYVDLVETRN